MSNFNYQHLNYFYRTAQKNSFSEAARSLHISQPALSMQIKQFEEHWGFPLFHRMKGRISLTEEGGRLFDYAKAIFDLGEEAEASLLGAGVPMAPSVRMGVSVAVPKAVAHALLEYFYQTHPGLHLVLKQDRIEVMIEALNAHKLDLVVNDAPYQSEEKEGVRNHLAATIPMVFCASRKIAGKYKTMPDDLNGAPLIVPTAPDQTYHAMQNYIQLNKIKPRIAAEVQDLELVKSLTVAGKGIGLLNLYAVMNSSERKDLVVLKDRSRYKIQDTIYLISRHKKIPNPLVDRVLEKFRLYA